MGLDLDFGAELVAQRRFQAVGDFVRARERQAAVDFEIERDRQLPADGVHGDVMHGERAVARDHHHALQHRLVVERARHDVDGGLGVRHRVAHGGLDLLLDRDDAVKRERAAHAR